MITKENKIKINTILMAVLICTSVFINAFGLGHYLLIIPTIIFLFMKVINFEKKINIKYLLADLFFVIIALYIYMNYRKYGKNEYLVIDTRFFIVYGIFLFITMRNVINVKKMLNWILVFYIIAMPFFMTLDFSTYPPGNLMALSYSVLPMLLTLIIKIVLYKNKSWKEKILMLATLPYFYFVAIYSSRGVYLACISCFVLCELIKPTTYKRVFILIIILMVGIIIVLNALTILYSIQSLLNSYNISFKIIDKNIRLLEQEDLSNGRDMIYSVAMDEINEKYILGNGIGQFNIRYGTYPHNFVLQLMHEGGIVLTFIYIIPILYGIYAILIKKNISQNMKILLIFLFSASIIRLCISYEYWKEPFFWMYLSVCIISMLEKDITHEEVKNNGNSNNTNL